MKNRISRRNFLKISGLALGTLAFSPIFPYYEMEGYGEIVRIAVKEIDLHAEPNDKSEIIGKRYRDQIIHVYEEVISPHGPSYNPLWYRVWGGYIHSAHIQKVKVQLNQPLSYVPESGVLAEVTVPYTPAYELKDHWKLWESAPIYYSTTHWITGIVEGPDRNPWYQITSELTDTLSYYLPAAHLRPIPDEEISPLSADVPIGKKKIEVSIGYQTLKAYEYDEVVFSTRVSTGIHSRLPSKNGIPTDTPKGKFHIFSKMPNKHMGSVSGNPDDDNSNRFSLPGVPWTCFFHTTGVAFHGTYWHNNFGIQMSHGCINMRNEDAKWLFRWTTPAFNTPIKSRADWEQKGMGTPVFIS